MKIDLLEIKYCESRKLLEVEMAGMPSTSAYLDREQATIFLSEIVKVLDDYELLGDIDEG